MKKQVWWYLSFFILGIGLSVGGTQLKPAQAAETNRVGLVVSYGDGRIETQCISFSADNITGLEALQASGLLLEVDYNSVGAAVCKIGNVGCPADDCFCDSPPNFWSYWHLTDGNWVFSQLGAGSYRVSDGAVEGWIWGTGQSNPPPQATFDQVCAEQPTPTPTDAPIPTATEAPTPEPTQTTAPVQEEVNATEEGLELSEDIEPSVESNPLSNTPVSIYFPMISKMDGLPLDSPLSTGITPTHTATTTPTSTPIAATQQTSAENLSANSNSGKNPGSYLFLGIIVAGLGIGLLVVKQRKWK